MQSMITFTGDFGRLLEKMKSVDKDLRFMATNDLIFELEQGNFKLDDDSERKVVRMLLQLLDDKNGEVQNLAVKCIGLLVLKVKDEQVENIIETLCNNMVSEREQLRDVSCMGVKSIASKLPQAPEKLCAKICNRIAARLVVALDSAHMSIQLDVLDIIADLLASFGDTLLAFHGTILNALLPKMRVVRQAVHKRAITACSNLVYSCDSNLYVKLIGHLHAGLEDGAISPQSQACMQCVAAVCRKSGLKFCKHIDRFLPLILEADYDDNEEIQEYRLKTLEVFLRQCPKEAEPYIPAIIELGVKALTYDPNYTYDEGQDDEPEPDKDDEDDDYSDDEDMSWKIRRAAAKCLDAVISSSQELLPEFYRTLSPVLIAQFKERTEYVQSDVFHAFITLLKQTKEVETVADLLTEQIPLIMENLRGQMKKTSLKTRQDCFQLLKHLCAVTPGALTSHIEEALIGIQYSLNKKNSSNIKIDALSLMRCLLTTHHPELFQPYIGDLLPLVTDAIEDGYYKVTAEALRVLQELVIVARPLNVPVVFDYVTFASKVYNCTYEKLKLPSADQEIKERAIATMGQIIRNLGDCLQDELPTCLPIFVDRLKNENTRLITLKVLNDVVTSPLCLRLPIVNNLISILGLFLRKEQRPLKLGTLSLLNCLINNYYQHINIKLLQHTIAEMSQVLNETDLHVTQAALVVLNSAAQNCPSALENSSKNVLPAVMHLLKSPLLEGTIVNSMLSFFRSLVRCNLPGLEYNDLLQMLLLPISQEESLHTQVYHSLAKCVAGISLACTNQALPLVDQLTQRVLMRRGDSEEVFFLLTIGEIGFEIDLTSIDDLKKAILQSFGAESKEIKSAASYALGRITAGNLEECLPMVLSEIEQQPDLQYLLLYSLKVVITSSPEGVNRLLPFIPGLWPRLLTHCDSPEESTRNIIAECLGKLTLTNPSDLLPQLQKLVQSPSPLMRATVVKAIKFTISARPQNIDAHLSQSIGTFLNTLQDPDVNVRRVALELVNSAAHNKPSIIINLLESILPLLYKETRPKRELIREVEMGPFKHIVDDGLDIRKVAFECMYTLLNSCLNKIDVAEFLNNVESGLKDHHDIKLLAYLIATKLVRVCPAAVVQNLDRLVGPLRDTCTAKVKQNSLKQEFEKDNELKRCALRTVLALLTIPEANRNIVLGQFVAEIKSTPNLVKLFESLQKDTSAIADDSFMMDM